jgi:hypothetical protein
MKRRDRDTQKEEQAQLCSVLVGSTMMSKRRREVHAREGINRGEPWRGERETGMRRALTASQAAPRNCSLELPTQLGAQIGDMTQPTHGPGVWSWAIFMWYPAL